MKGAIKTAKDIVKHNGVVQKSDNIYGVMDHEVIIQKKKGRKLLLCSCDNASYFGHNQTCIHKLCVIVYLSNEDFLTRINKLITDYERFKKHRLEIGIDNFINDLRDIRSKF